MASSVSKLVAKTYGAYNSPQLFDEVAAALGRVSAIGMLADENGIKIIGADGEPFSAEEETIIAAALDAHVPITEPLPGGGDWLPLAVSEGVSDLVGVYYLVGDRVYVDLTCSDLSPVEDLVIKVPFRYKPFENTTDCIGGGMTTDGTFLVMEAVRDRLEVTSLGSSGSTGRAWLSFSYKLH